MDARKLIQIVILVAVAVFVRQSNGYSRGAPDMACNVMEPRHGPSSQTSPPPYSITPLQTVIEPGGMITIRMASLARDDFRGFMIEAYNTDNNSPGALGSFIDPLSNTKTLTCSPGLQNALTHGDARGKNSLDIKWQAPSNFQGEIIFRATFVKDYATFWVRVPASTSVRVGRSVPQQNQSTLPLPNGPASYPVSTTTSTTTRIVSTTPNTIVSTNSWSFPTPAPTVSTAAQMAPVYSGCGDTKGCFGLYDPTCIEKGSCQALVTYALKGTRYEFELWAPNAQQNSYVAVAMSSDDKMGDDSVTECTLVNGRVNAYMSYNDGKINTRLRDPALGLSQVVATFTDGNLYCRFTRDSPFSVQGHTFDLKNGYYLLLARGPASDSKIEYHAGQKVASARSVQLAETGSVGARKGTLVKLHGAFMVAAWLFCASLGILFARYFRLTWVGKQIMEKDLWFVFHRILMILTWLLTMVAFVLIFIELDGWTSVPLSINPHSLIGVIVTVLAFIQPIMANFRPHPGTPKRFIFNWAHWLVGNTAHILAIVCIFLAVGLPRAAIPDWVNWLLVTYVIIHAFTHLILSLAQCCYHADGSRKATVFAMRDLAPHQSNQNNHFYSTQQDKKEDAHGSNFRKIVLFFYILLVVSFAAAVIGVIVTGPWSK